MSELKSYYTEHTPYLYRLFLPNFVKKMMSFTNLKYTTYCSVVRGEQSHAHSVDCGYWNVQAHRHRDDDRNTLLLSEATQKRLHTSRVVGVILVFLRHLAEALATNVSRRRQYSTTRNTTSCYSRLLTARGRLAQRHGRPRIGANRVSWPPGKMDEKLKSGNMQKGQFSMFMLYFESNQGRQV